MGRFALALLAFVASVIVADATYATPSVSAEFDVDPPIVTVQPVVPRTNLAVAYNGSTYLALFDAEGSHRARRIDATGTPIDTSDIILEPSTSGGSPVIADGSDFIANLNGQLARIYASGVLGPQFTPPINPGAMARGANGLFLLYQNSAALVDGSGTVLHAPVAYASFSCAVPRVVYGNGIYLVACNINGAVSFVRFDEWGNPLDAAPVAAFSGNLFPSVAVNGSEFLIVSTTSTGCVGRRLDATGTFLSPLLTFATCPSSEILVVGSEYYFPYTKSSPSRIEVQRYSTTGAAVGAPITVDNVSVGTPHSAAAADGSVYVHLGGGTVYGAHLDASATPTAQGVPISINAANVANDEVPFGTKPVAATNAAGITLVVWEDGRTSPTTIWGTRIGPDGSPLQAQAFQIVANNKTSTAKSLATNGTDFLLAYKGPFGSGSIPYVVRIGGDGTVFTPVQIPKWNLNYLDLVPALASDGTGYVYYQEVVQNPDVDGGFAVGRAGWLDANGNLIGQPVNLDPGGGQGKGNGIFDGANYFFAFPAYQYGNGEKDAKTRRFSPVSGVVDPAGTIVGQNIPANDYGGGASIAYAGGTRLVMFGLAPALMNRVAADNTVIDFAATPVPGSGYPIALTSTGTGFIAAFGQNGTMQGAEIDTQLVSGPLFQISDDPSGGGAFVNHGKLIVYSRYLPQDGYRCWRIRARIIGGGGSPDGQPCNGPTDCTSSYCVDGVCCDQACDGDCEACSVATGAGSDGACGPIAQGTVCRDAAFECDAVEACDGVDPDCPTDLVEPDGTACNGGECVAGACDTSGGGGQTGAGGNGSGSGGQTGAGGNGSGSGGSASGSGGGSTSGTGGNGGAGGDGTGVGGAGGVGGDGSAAGGGGSENTGGTAQGGTGAVSTVTGSGGGAVAAGGSPSGGGSGAGNAGDGGSGGGCSGCSVASRDRDAAIPFALLLALVVSRRRSDARAQATNRNDLRGARAHSRLDGGRLRESSGRPSTRPNRGRPGHALASTPAASL